MDVVDGFFSRGDRPEVRIENEAASLHQQVVIAPLRHGALFVDLKLLFLSPNRIDEARGRRPFRGCQVGRVKVGVVERHQHLALVVTHKSRVPTHSFLVSWVILNQQLVVDLQVRLLAHRGGPIRLLRGGW